MAPRRWLTGVRRRLRQSYFHPRFLVICDVIAIFNNQNCSFLKPSLFSTITILNTGVRCKYLCCDNGRIPFALCPFQVDECMKIRRYMYDNGKMYNYKSNR